MHLTQKFGDFGLIIEPLLVKILDNRGADLDIGQQSTIPGHPGESWTVDNPDYFRFYRPKSIRIPGAALSFSQRFQLRRHVHQRGRLCPCVHYKHTVADCSLWLGPLYFEAKFSIV